MKNEKRKIAPALLEALFELVLTLVCLGIGIVVLALFGVDLTSPDLDYDFIILLGVGIFLALFIGSYFLVEWIKKRFGKRQ